MTTFPSARVERRPPLPDPATRWPEQGLVLIDAVRRKQPDRAIALFLRERGVYRFSVGLLAHRDGRWRIHAMQARGSLDSAMHEYERAKREP